MRALSKRQVSAAAWSEYKVTRAVAGAAGEEMLAMERAPGGFVAIELGFGFGEGPSIIATMQDVGRAGEHNRVLLGDRRMVRKADLERPERGAERGVDVATLVQPRRESASQRGQRLDVMLRRDLRKAKPMGGALVEAIDRASRAA